MIGKLPSACGYLALVVTIASYSVPDAASCSEPAGAKIEQGIELTKVAGFVHAIAAANREAYSQMVVNRLTIQEKVIEANEHYAEKRALPLPAQLFRWGAELLNNQSRTAAYSLQSFWALRRENAPRTELEKIGLAKMLGGAEHFYGKESDSRTNAFIAAYPDIATNEACVSCHNNHPDSRRQDFRIGEVMGGVVVRIFLDVENGHVQGSNYRTAALEGGQPASLDYRDVADLIYAVIAANREAYSKLFVERLTLQEKVIAADEDYIRKKCLPLPVQLLNLSSLLIGEKNRIATYALRPAWALNKNNAPKSETEKAGLASVAGGNDRFYGIEAAGTSKALIAVYPDKVTDQSCAACHNNHEKSPRRDFKPGDVMGGVVVRIPMSN
jgi:Protein of unknown function (DUF3365)